jgi:hypothetical protein
VYFFSYWYVRSETSQLIFCNLTSVLFQFAICFSYLCFCLIEVIPYFWFFIVHSLFFLLISLLLYVVVDSFFSKTRLALRATCCCLTAFCPHLMLDKFSIKGTVLFSHTLGRLV